MNSLLVIGLAVLVGGLGVALGLLTGFGGRNCGEFGMNCIGSAAVALPLVLIPACVLILKGAAVARAAASHSFLWTTLGVIVALAAAASLVPLVVVGLRL